MKRFTVMIGIVAAGLMLTACGSSPKTTVNTQTTGQQLTDLKAAFDQGVITQDEYDKKRAEILKGK